MADIDDDGVDFEGCHYDDWADAFWVGTLNFCGCGSPEQLLPAILAYLAWCGREQPDTGVDYQAFLAAKDPADPWAEGSYRDDLTLLIAYVCDRAGLTEHGGSIGWPWITEKGKEWLARLSEPAAPPPAPAAAPPAG